MATSTAIEQTKPKKSRTLVKAVFTKVAGWLFVALIYIINARWVIYWGLVALANLAVIILFARADHDLTIGAGVMLFLVEVLLVLLGLYLTPWLLQPIFPPTGGGPVNPPPPPPPPPNGTKDHPLPPQDPPLPPKANPHINTCCGEKADANLREQPCGPVKAVLPNGTEFQPQALSNACGHQWYYVNSPSGYGWLHKCFIEGAN